MKLRLNPYLFFDGKCAEAINFYAKCFGGELKLLTYKEVMKEKTPPKFENQIMHAYLKAGDLVMMASDQGPNMKYDPPNNSLGLLVDCESEEHLETLFKLLSEGGNPQYPPHDTSWVARFSSFKDRFGFGWMLNFDRNPQR